MKKFEPHYRLVRYGAATKIEKASRQQRTYKFPYTMRWDAQFGLMVWECGIRADYLGMDRQATQEPSQDCAGDGQGEGGGIEGQEEVKGVGCVLVHISSREEGGACSCVPTLCSRMLWRVRNTKIFKLRIDVCDFIFLNDFISMLKNTSKTPAKPPKTPYILTFCACKFLKR